MTMTMIALDIATVTGWACDDGSSGIIDLSGYEDYGERGMRFSDALVDLWQDTDSDVWVFEQPVTRFHNSYLTSGLSFIAHMVAYELGIKREEVKVTTWRKELLGKGNATKAMAKEWCRVKGFKPKTHDEAEALCILHWAQGERHE